MFWDFQRTIINLDPQNFTLTLDLSQFGGQHLITVTAPPDFTLDMFAIENLEDGMTDWKWEHYYFYDSNSTQNFIGGCVLILETWYLSILSSVAGAPKFLVCFRIVQTEPKINRKKPTTLVISRRFCHVHVIWILTKTCDNFQIRRLTPAFCVSNNAILQLLIQINFDFRVF